MVVVSMLREPVAIKKRFYNLFSPIKE